MSRTQRVAVAPSIATVVLLLVLVLVQGRPDDARGGIQLVTGDSGSVVQVRARSGGTRELRP